MLHFSILLCDFFFLSAFLSLLCTPLPCNLPYLKRPRIPALTARAGAREVGWGGTSGKRSPARDAGSWAEGSSTRRIGLCNSE